MKKNAQLTGPNIYHLPPPQRKMGKKNKKKDEWKTGKWSPDCQ